MYIFCIIVNISNHSWPKVNQRVNLNRPYNCIGSMSLFTHFADSVCVCVCVFLFG